jgi:multidrug transporter EmrE-like cation transporter
MLNLRTLLFGALFGAIDATSLPIIKNVSLGWDFKWMIVPFLLYAASPFVFLKGLATESLTILNLVWDLSSDVIITLIGLLVFKETIPPLKLLGVALSFVALFLMSYEGDGWNTWLATNFERVRHAVLG